MTEEEFKATKESRVERLGEAGLALSRELTSILGASQRKLIDDVLMNALSYLFKRSELPHNADKKQKNTVEMSHILEHFGTVYGNPAKEINTGSSLDVLINTAVQIGAQLRFEGKNPSDKDAEAHFNEIKSAIVPFVAAITGWKEVDFKLNTFPMRTQE